MASLPRDDNRVPTIGGVSSVDGRTPTTVYVNPSTHAMLTSVSGAGSGGTSSVDHDAFTAGTSAGTAAMGVYETSPTTLTNGQLGVMELDSTRSLKVHVTANDVGGGGGTSAADDSTFTAGITTFTPTGGVYNDSVAAATSGKADTVRISQNRGMHVNLRNNAGTELGTSSTPLQVSLANTAANATAVKVDNSAVTQPVSGTVTVNAGTNLNTSALALDATLTGGTQQSKITDGTNIASTLKSDGSAAGQNALMVSGTGYSTATLTLNAGSPNTAWFDMLNYPYLSIELLTNTTPSTLTFQTSGDVSQTNARSTPLFDSTNQSNVALTTSTSATATLFGPRTGRYFRVSSNTAGGNTVTLVITFYTTAPFPVTVGGQVQQSGTWTVQPGNTANTTAWKVDNSAVIQPVSESGTWTVQPGNTPNSTPWLVTTTPGTTGGWSVSKQTALTSTAVSVKASAGTFGGYMTLYNPNTAVTYIQVWDVALVSVTVGTTAPTYVITLPGVASAAATGSAANIELVNGINHTTAIVIAATTTPTGASAPANNIIGTILYK